MPFLTLHVVHMIKGKPLVPKFKWMRDSNENSISSTALTLHPNLWFREQVIGVIRIEDARTIPLSLFAELFDETLNFLRRSWISMCFELHVHLSYQLSKVMGSGKIRTHISSSHHTDIKGDQT